MCSSGLRSTWQGWARGEVTALVRAALSSWWGWARGDGVPFPMDKDGLEETGLGAPRGRGLGWDADGDGPGAVALLGLEGTRTCRDTTQWWRNSGQWGMETVACRRWNVGMRKTMLWRRNRNFYYRWMWFQCLATTKADSVRMTPLSVSKRTSCDARAPLSGCSPSWQWWQKTKIKLHMQ